MTQVLPSLLDEAPGSQTRPRARSAADISTPGEGSLVVVPTYNERENLPELLREIFAAAPGADVLIVDDNSPDGTGELATELSRQEPRLHVLRRPGKLGLGTAYLAGFRWGLSRRYRRFIEMDADFSHDPRELCRFYAALERGADVVVGSRNIAGGAIHGWGPGRLLLSKGGSAYSRLVLGIGVRDLTTGYKAFTRRALERLGLDQVCSNGYAFQIETTYRALCAALRVEEVPITFVDRRVGSSKMDRGIFFEAVRIVWQLRLRTRRAPRRLARG